MSRYRVIRMPSHPLATKRGYVQRSRAVLYQKLGPGTHPCHWCQTALIWKTDTRTKGNSLLADHIDLDPQNDSPDNLVPSCNRCNTRRKHPDNIRPDEITAMQGENRTRGIALICTECGSLYTRPRSQLRHLPSSFCSRACRNRSVNRRTPRRHDPQTGRFT